MVRIVAEAGDPAPMCQSAVRSGPDNLPMELQIPFAATLAEGCAYAIGDLQLPTLTRLLGRLAPAARLGSDEASLTPPHELALAAALGWHAVDGCLPWAARLAQQDGVDDVAGRPWGLLTPVHWSVSADGVMLVDPAALALGQSESRALFDAARDLFDEGEGWRVAYGAPLRWYASHERLRDLPCASIERAIGQQVDAWMRSGPVLSVVRRLQSEVQMRLHDAPVNAAREGRGALAVNSFWLSGCGVAQPEAQDFGVSVSVDDRLRAPALAQDWAAWAEAWRALDEGPIAELLRRSGRGEPVALTLCGERFAQRFEPASGGGVWSRLTRGLRAPALAATLEAL